MSILHPPVRIVTGVKDVEGQTVVMLDCGHEVEYQAGSQSTKKGVRCPYCPGVTAESESEVQAALKNKKARKANTTSGGGTRVSKNIEAKLSETGELVKECSACGETKSTTQFYAYPRSSDGFYHKCKSCYNQATSRVKRQEEAAAKKEAKAQAREQAGEEAEESRMLGIDDKPARRNGRKAKAQVEETTEIVDGAGSDEAQAAIAEELAGVEA